MLPVSISVSTKYIGNGGRLVDSSNSTKGQRDLKPQKGAGSKWNKLVRERHGPQPQCLPQVEVGCSLFLEDGVLPEPESSSALPDSLSYGFQAYLASPHHHISPFLATNLSLVPILCLNAGWLTVMKRNEKLEKKKIFYAWRNKDKNDRRFLIKIHNWEARCTTSLKEQQQRIVNVKITNITSTNTFWKRR